MSTFYGNSGDNSTVYGGTSNDSMYGGGGNDTLTAGDGSDSLWGGSGNDSANADGGADYVTMESGNDTAHGGAGNDMVAGGDGRDSLTGGDNEDSLYGDGFLVWNMGQYASAGSSTTSTLNFTNSADGPVNIYYVNTSGQTVMVGTVQPGQSLSIPAHVGDNYMVISPEGYYLDVINVTATTQSASFGAGGNADTIYGGTGQDLIEGMYGDDSLSGDDGNDTVRGGTGNDQIFGGSGRDSLYGDAGNDTIDGGNDDDRLFGGDGNDSLLGGGGNDTVEGGAGNDIVYAGSGNDSVQLGDGNDKFGDWSADDSGNDTVYGGAGNDSIIGGAGDDSVYGDDGNDWLSGQMGNDQLFGGGGADTFAITDDHQGDTIYGGETGTDTDYVTFSTYQSTQGVNVTFTGSEAGTYAFAGTTGSGSFSQIEGISGTTYDDTLNATGAGSAVSLYGDAGNDVISLGTANANNLVYGGAGNDTITNDIGTSSGSDTLYGGDGRDVITMGVNDSVDGGSGGDDFDTLDMGSAPAGVSVTLTSTGTGTAGSGGTSGSFSEIERFNLSAQNDTFQGGNDTVGVEVVGGAGSDYVVGGSGADTVYGGTGNDSVFAGSGNDAVYGGDGNDWIEGREGNDTVYGGAGNDTIDDETGAGNSTGNDLTYGDAGNDTIWSGNDHDTVYGGADNDQISGESGNDSLYGDTGDDRVYGDAGNDQVFGGDGNDQVYGGSGNDQVSGDAGNDRIFSDAGNDSLYGGSGNDTFTGGTGNDLIAGGADTDTVVFTGPVTGYSFDYAPGGGLIVTDNTAGRDGIDTISGAEYVSFNGVTYRLVTGDDGSNTTLQGPDGEPALIIAHDGNDWGGGHATSDVIFGGAGDDTLDGGDGNDTLVGEGDNDLLRGDGGNDSLVGGDGNDTLQGGAGNDVLDGGTGNDLLQGGAGNDTLSGGTGNDLLSGGAGNDMLSGGDGRDVFELTVGGNADLVTDFNLTDSGDGTAIDQLDVSDLTTAQGDPVRTWDVAVSDDGNGNAVLTFPGGESVVLQGISPAMASSPGMMHAMGVPCLAAGTQIQTPSGPRAVEHLAVGDRVMTAKGEVMPILWRGHRALGPQDLDQRPQDRPVHFAAGSMGNLRAMRLSAQHAVQVPGHGLIRARHLVGRVPGVRLALGVKCITYHHLLLPRHALLLAEGAAQVESLYPGRQTLAALSADQRLTLAAAILDTQTGPIPPGTELCALYGPLAAPILTGARAQASLAARVTVAATT